MPEAALTPERRRSVPDGLPPPERSPFVELGLAIKQASPFRTTLVVELANCVETIYVPTRAAYAQGSYEVTNSTVQPGSGEMLVEEAVRQLRSARE